jgi:hypothetical protein
MARASSLVTNYSWASGPLIIFVLTFYSGRRPPYTKHKRGRSRYNDFLNEKAALPY